MAGFFDDVGHAFRTLRQNPGFASTVVLTLGLGLGATSAIFTVAYGVLLRPLPYPEPDRIVSVQAIDLENPELPGGFSGPNFHALRQQSRSFVAIAGMRPTTYTLTADDTPPESLNGLRVSAEFFAVMGGEPTLGRFFDAKDDREGADHVVVLSHGGWQRRFGGHEDVIGQRLTLSGDTYTVIGVVATSFEPSYDLFVPLAVDHATESPGRHYLTVRARLHEGISPAQAQGELRTLVARHVEEHPELRSARDSVAIRTLLSEIVGDHRQPILLLHAAVLLVLGIACVNVAHLLLSRSAARRREIALHSALGAGRGRLLRIFFLENLCLAPAGSAAAIGVAVLATGTLVQQTGAPIPRSGDVRVDLVAIAVTAGLSLAIAGILSWLPLRDAVRLRLTDALRDGDHRLAVGRSRLRSTLVMVEVALALVLLIGAGLMINSLSGLLRVDPGLEAKGVITARLTLPDTTYDSEPKIEAFYQRLFAHIAAIPGVEEVGAVHPLPLSGGFLGGLFGLRDVELPQEAQLRFVEPGTFDALGIPVVSGRGFQTTDRLETPPVVVINQSAVRRFWPRVDPVGQQVTFDPEGATWWTIVGVVGDVREDGLANPVPPAIHFSIFQRPTPSLTLVARADPAQEEDGLISALRSAVAEIDPRLPLHHVQPLSDVVDLSSSLPRFHARLFSALATLALILAAVGVYGLLSHSVHQRRQEIGIRRALGARRGDIASQMLRQGLKPVGVGLIVGVGAAFVLTRFLSTLLYDLEPTDPPTFLGVCGFLAIVALAACWIPARRAASIDPAQVLRNE